MMQDLEEEGGGFGGGHGVDVNDIFAQMFGGGMRGGSPFGGGNPFGGGAQFSFGGGGGMPGGFRFG